MSRRKPQRNPEREDDPLLRWLTDDERAEYTADKAHLLKMIAEQRQRLVYLEPFNLDSFIGTGFHVLDAVDTARNMFRLDGLVFEVLEDENDGYRSALDHVMVRNLVSFRPNIAPVEVEIKEAPSEGDDSGAEGFPYWTAFRGHSFVTEEGRLVLLVGTNNTDDYYPSFTFFYRPVGAP